MQQAYDEIIKIQNKGVLTIPKRLRGEDFDEQKLVRIKREKGRLIIEPVRTLPYSVRSYSDKDIDDFITLDEVETKELREKGLI